MDKDNRAAIFQTLSRVTSTEGHPAISRPSSLSEPSALPTLPPTDPEKAIGEQIIETETQKNPNLVDWDGPDDPEKPINWTKKKKWTNLVLIATLTLLTPFGSTMFAPGVPQMMEDFHQNSPDLASFSVSIYILGYALGPLFIAPLSELYGRVPVYHVCTFFFMVFTLACGLSTSLGMIIFFRFVAGLAGSCPITIGSGTVADCWKQEERGTVMSAWTLPILLGLVAIKLCPAANTNLCQPNTWPCCRWIYEPVCRMAMELLLAFNYGMIRALLTVESLTFLQAAVVLVATVVGLPETYPTVLLERKAKKLRKETGNQDFRAPSELSGRSPGRILWLNLIRPTKMLLFSPIVFGLSLYIAVVYGYLYIMFSTLTPVFGEQYGIKGGNVGLTFLGLGIGQVIGLFMFASTSDKQLKKRAAQNGGVMKPEFRLPFLLHTSLFTPAGLILYGWSAEYKVHWIVPIIGTCLISIGMLCTFMPIANYLVDAFTIFAASAIAANTVFRSLGGAFLPLAGRRLFSNLGLGWGSTLLAFIALAFVPFIWFLEKYAEKMRTDPRWALKKL